MYITPLCSKEISLFIPWLLNMSLIAIYKQLIHKW